MGKTGEPIAIHETYRRREAIELRRQLPEYKTLLEQVRQNQAADEIALVTGVAFTSFSLLSLIVSI